MKSNISFRQSLKNPSSSREIVGKEAASLASASDQERGTWEISVSSHALREGEWGISRHIAFLFSFRWEGEEKKKNTKINPNEFTWKYL